MTEPIENFRIALFNDPFVLQSKRVDWSIPMGSNSFFHFIFNKSHLSQITIITNYKLVLWKKKRKKNQRCWWATLCSRAVKMTAKTKFCPDKQLSWPDIVRWPAVILSPEITMTKLSALLWLLLYYNIHNVITYTLLSVHLKLQTGRDYSFSII